MGEGRVGINRLVGYLLHIKSLIDAEHDANMIKILPLQRLVDVTCLTESPSLKV